MISLVKKIMNKLKKINSFFNKYQKRFKQFYNQKFHKKFYAPLIYALLVCAFLSLIIFLNIIFMAKGQYNLTQINWVLSHWNAFEENDIGVTGQIFDALKRGWYTVFATTIGGLGMTLAAVSAQSLTRNPLAEGSTLGLIQASIFGVVFSIWIASTFNVLTTGISEIFAKFGFAIIFAVINALFLLLFIVTTKRSQLKAQKIILAGLAMGIIFKTLTFIFKANNGNLNVVSYVFVLGGAETVANEPLAMRIDDMSLSLIISAIAIGIALILVLFNIKGMNLLEIGDERAKNLGSSVLLTRILNIIIVLLALPSSVILVGNMAFLGLFAIHAARWMSSSRNYFKVLPLSLLIGIAMANLGMQLTNHLPQINSGIWMTFIGAPYLIYIGIRGLK